MTVMHQDTPSTLACGEATALPGKRQLQTLQSLKRPFPPRVLVAAVLLCFSALSAPLRARRARDADLSRGGGWSVVRLSTFLDTSSGGVDGGSTHVSFDETEICKRERDRLRRTGGLDITGVFYVTTETLTSAYASLRSP
jgi:hypothetical protein